MNKPISLAEQLLLSRPRLVGYAGLLILMADLVAIVASALLANMIHYWLIVRPQGGAFDEIWAIGGAETRLLVFTALEVAAIFWFFHVGHYSKRSPFWDEIAQTTRILAVVAALDAITLYLLKLPFSRFWFVATWALAIALLPILRALTKDLLIKSGLWQKPTLVLGTGHNAQETVKALRGEPMMGLIPIALVSLSDEHLTPQATSLEARLPVIRMSDVEALALEQSRQLPIFVALDDYGSSADNTLIRKIRRLFKDIRIVPPVTGFPLYGAEVHHLFRQELFFLTVRNNLGSHATRVIKRAFDIVVSALSLLLLSPLFVYLMLRIKVDHGPAFFAHQRIGLDGKPFPCYKFRTMVPNAADVLERLLRENEHARREWDEAFKLKDDPRVTKIGAFLRRTSLDELPQLWNVFIGQMSLVGPRPIVFAELARYGDDAFYYLEARPGITGVWQVSGRSDTDYTFRVYLDSWYAKNWSLWYDIVILIKTLRVVLSRTGAY